MSFRRTAIYSSIITAISSPGLALADEAASDDNLEVMVVTASRIETKLKDVTGSVAVFSAEDIANRKPIVVSDILRSSPGVAVNRAGGLGSFTQVRIRGSEANQVLVLIDGVEANDVGIGSEFNFANVLSNDISQIEVLRGPQSSLWGSGAVAGVISISTQKSDQPFGINGYLEGGSFDTYSAGLNLGGAGEKFNYRISAGYADSEGENISRQGSERDGYTNKTLNLSAGYDFTDTINLSGFYRRTEADRDFDGTNFDTGLPEDADKNTEAVFDYAGLKGHMASFQGAWINELGVTYNQSANDNLTDGLLDTGTEGTKTRGYWQSTWLPGANDNNSLTFVAKRIEETYKQAATDISFGDANRDLSQHTNGFVGEYNHFWQSGWKLSLSARHDDNEDFKDANTYRAGILYDRLDDGWQLRASYGTGVKNPTFVERYGYYETGGPLFIGNPDLKPESSKSWEIGTTLKTRNNFFQLDLTYFNERLEDEVNGYYYDAELGATTAINMDGTSKRDGVELGSWFNFTDNLAMYVAYTYLDAREPEVDGSEPLEIRRPRHIASANLNYRFFNERGKFNINADYNGEMEDIFFGPPTYNQRVTLDAYTLVGAMLSFRVIDNLEIYARGENLLDEEYEEVFGFDGQSRAGYLGFRFDWSL
jgi:vitamin B12 transporter